MWFKGVLMITMMTTKDDEQKAQRSKNNSSESKNISRESRRIQDSRRNPRIKHQDSRSQDSRLKIQEWRKDSIKISIKKNFQNFE